MLMTSGAKEKKVLFFIEQAGSLQSMPRSHIRSLGNTFDTIASHSFHVSVIAYCIARMENLSHEEAMEASVMATFHDLAEARTGDLDFIAKNYNKDDEAKAVDDQLKNLYFGKELHALLDEYEERKSLKSKCAKDADGIAQMYIEWVLTWRGNKLAQNWFEGSFRVRVPNMYTKSAKRLAHSMKDSNPNEWWWAEFVSKKGQPKNLSHLMGKAFKKH